MINLSFLLASLSCFLTITSGEPPVPTHYQHQKKLSATQKIPSYTPKQAVHSPTNFGFVPVKTAETYTQKEPLGRYIYPDLLEQTQTFTGKYPQYPQTEAIFNNQAPQYYQQSVAAYTKPKIQQVTQHYQQPQQYVQQQYVQSQQYVKPQQYVEPQQFVQQYVQPTQDYAQKYVYMTPQSQQPQFYYQTSPATKNLNYITDNHVPQYVYLQQVSDSSNNVENVVDSRGEGIKYIMFLPTYVPQQPESQNYQNYYTTQDTASHSVAAEAVQAQPEQQVQYVYNTEPTPVEHTKESARNREPTSLLDSYIPSSLQIQYYKRLAAQSEANQVTDSEKAVTQTLKKKNARHER